MITTKPSPYGNGRVQVYDDDQFVADCPAEAAERAAQHHIDTHARHFGEIAQRQQDGDPRLVIAMHLGKLTAFSIGSPDDYPRGFGGDTWHITFDDGRTETTCSLWHHGPIPTDWQDRIVKNARFGHGLVARR